VKATAKTTEAKKELAGSAPKKPEEPTTATAKKEESAAKKEPEPKKKEEPAKKKEEVKADASKKNEKSDVPKIVLTEDKKKEEAGKAAPKIVEQTTQQSLPPNAAPDPVTKTGNTLDPTQGASTKELKPPSSRQKPDGSPGRKDATSGVAPIEKKKEVDVNPYLAMVDIDDLLTDDKHKYETIRNLTNTMLRYHAHFKTWYKKFSPLAEHDTEDTISFALDLGTMWKFIKETKIGNHRLTLAAFNRCFLQSTKNEFDTSLNIVELKRELKYEKHQLTQQQAQQGNHDNAGSGSLVLDAVQPGIRLPKIDWDRYADDAQDKPLPNHMFIPTLGYKEVHDDKRVVFFRQFVDSIVRMAYLKYEVSNMSDLPKYLERLLVQRIVPFFEGKKKAMSHASNDDEMILNKYLPLVARHSEALKRLFLQACINRQTEQYGMKDYTLSFKSLIDLLSVCAIAFQ
jgi:hypothetical protein